MLAETPERFRQKAQACRRLAVAAENVMREALWLDRADYWEQRAKEAEKLRLKKAKLSADYFQPLRECLFSLAGMRRFSKTILF